MKITELETILEQLLEDKAIVATKTKSVLINDMLSVCRNVNGLHYIVNNISDKDTYVEDIMFMLKEFTADFVSATTRKLLAAGIDIIDDYESKSKARRVVIKNETPYAPPGYDPAINISGYYPQQPVPPLFVPTQPQMQPQYQAYPQYPTYPNQAYPNQAYPQQMQPQQQYVQPAPVMEQAPVVPQPVPPQPAPQPVAPQPAPVQQPVPSVPVAQESPAPAPSSSSNTPPPTFDLGAFGGGNDKPAAGRDFLLSILNK